MGLVLASFVAILASSAVIALLRPAATAVGLVDKPGQRRRHDVATPVIGGIGIFAGFLAAVLLLGFPSGPWGTLLAGILLLGIVGLVDDSVGLRSGWRLLAQLAATSIVVLWGDMQITYLGNLSGFGQLGLWIFTLPFTVLCVMLMINAVNMLDGIDGLAGGLSLLMLLGFAVLMLLKGLAGWYVPLVMAFALIGFLAFNLRGPWRRQASVFMGDAGSTVLGFVLAWLAMYTTQFGENSAYPVTVAWILVLPAADALSLFFRRLSRGRNPLTPDRWHLHHVLVRSGFTMAGAVYLLIAVQALFVTIGIGGWYLGVPEWILFWPLAVLFGVYQVVMWRAPVVLRVLRRRLRPIGWKRQGVRKKDLSHLDP